ncbi:MAG: hypothetical protein ACPL6C_00680 [bacterium]
MLITKAKAARLALIIITFLFLGAVPLILNYQGKLTTPTGLAITDTLSMTFWLYDTATGGTPIWHEVHDTVVVSQGLFSVILGERTPLNTLQFNKQYWLEVQIGSETVLPRERLTSMPYAIRANYAEVAGEAITSPARFIPEYPQASLYPPDTLNAKVYITSGYDPATRRNYYHMDGLSGSDQAFNISFIWAPPRGFTSADSLRLFYITSNSDTTVSSVKLCLIDSSGDTLYNGRRFSSTSWSSIPVSTLTGLSGGENLVSIITLTADNGSWVRLGELEIYFR